MSRLLLLRLAIGLPIIVIACDRDTEVQELKATTPAVDAGVSQSPPVVKTTELGPCRGGVPVTDSQHYVPPGMCARMIAVKDLRQIMFAPNGDLFGSNGAKIFLFRDVDRNGAYAPHEITEWATAGSVGLGNNPWIDHANGFIYIGGDDGVVRFPYVPSDAVAAGPAQPVVVGQPAGGHAMRTVKIYDGWIYVDSGSAGNASDDTKTGDYDTKRSLIKRFELAKYVPGMPFPWDAGEPVAKGMRNPNGFTRNEKTKKMYAVVNGADNIMYAGRDEHFDNPGEQIVEIEMGRNYGYPFCFTAQRIVGAGGGSVVTPGTQLSFTTAGETNPHDDAWCGANALRPTGFVQAHSAPLDIAFFDNQPAGALDERYRGGAFIAMHGSWNREIGSTGYKVVWQPFHADGTTPQPTSTATDTTWPYEVVFGGGWVGGAPKDGVWNWAGPENQGEPGMVRPTGVAVSPIDGALYIATDKRLYRVGKKK